MKQSSVIFAALMIGFLVFVTIRGELSKYLGVLGIAPGPAGSDAPISGTTQSSSITPSIIV